MTFESFYECYRNDLKPKLKENTWMSKESIIEKKILPYFGKKQLCDIIARDVIAWQNEIRELKDPEGKKLSPAYLKSIHAQLSAMFNHAVRYYDLPENPALKAGGMGDENSREMDFWTQEEYLRFADAMMDKPMSYYAFELLYWCGIREAGFHDTRSFMEAYRKFEVAVRSYHDWLEKHPEEKKLAMESALDRLHRYQLESGIEKTGSRQGNERIDLER